MKYLVFDGSFMLHRAKFAAYKSIYTPNYISNIFLSTIIKESFEYKPDRIYVLWDGGRVAHRYESVDTYKSNRGSLEEEHLQASAIVEKILPLIGARSIRIPNTEADDLAYYLSIQTNQGRHISEDCDWKLNLHLGWELYRPVSKQLITWDSFKNEMSSDNPRLKFMYYKSLIGDGSDCIDGICGIGHVYGLRYAEKLINNESIGDSNTDKLIKNNMDLIYRNLKVVDTSWVCGHEDIVNEIKRQENVYNRNFDSSIYESINKSIESKSLAWWKWDSVRENFS